MVLDESNAFDLNNSSQWTISRVVLTQAERCADEIAIDFIDSTQWTFAECKQHALAAAGELQACGISQSSNVALLIDSPEAFCRYWLGLSFLGATMIAINTSMRGAPLKHQLDISDSHFLIADADHVKSCEAIQHKAMLYAISDLTQQSTAPLPIDNVYLGNSHDVSCIMFTSGTSGPSKGVIMPQAHCLLFAIGTIDNYQLTQQDNFYICLPLFHANGLFMQLLACLAIGCKAVVREKFSASRWLSEIRQYDITHTNTLGAVAAFIVAQPATSHDKDHSLKVIGAAPLPADSEQSFRVRFNIPSVVPLYGMTEVNIPLYGKLNHSAPGTCGQVYDKYFEVDIRHPETDEPVQDESIGEIMVRPKLANGFMAGYVGMPEATLDAWRNFWFHTGDAGYRHANGDFIFVDRIKDCIRKRGENISSYEVEQAFLPQADIAEVAAYAVPADGGDGMEDEVMIAVMLKANASKTPLQWVDAARENLPGFAVPRYIRIVDELPKTLTGKIRKVVLKKEGITSDTIDLIR